MIWWPCSTWVSEPETFPVHDCASTSQHKCKKVRDCSFPQLPRTEAGKDARKEAWSFPRSSRPSPQGTGGKVEQAAFPVWTRSQSIKTCIHNWVNELLGVDWGWGFTVGSSWSKIMLKGVFLTSFSFAVDLLSCGNTATCWSGRKLLFLAQCWLAQSSEGSENWSASLLGHTSAKSDVGEGVGTWDKGKNMSGDWAFQQ